MSEAAQRKDAAHLGSRLPLHVQIAESVLRDIGQGRLQAGDRLPPEREFANSLGVSVGTLRKALADLTKRGVIARKQGSGNYITQSQLPSSIYAFFNIELLDGGGVPSAKVLSCTRGLAPQTMPALPNRDGALCTRRLRFLSKNPCVLEEIWLDGAFANRLNENMIGPSLYQTYAHHLGLIITHAEDRIGLAPVPEWSPASWQMHQGQTTLCVTRLSWSNNGVLSEISQNWVDTQHAQYVARLR